MSDKPNKENWETYKVQHQCKLIHIDLSNHNKETWQCEGGLEVVTDDLEVVTDDLSVANAVVIGLLIYCFLFWFIVILRRKN